MVNRTAKSGILLLDKSKGPTSHDVVASLRRILGIRKIGHSGTLDPMASGLMVMCVGSFTRLNPWLTKADKTYRATVRFGGTSNTDDAEGTITPTDSKIQPTRSDIEGLFLKFKGEIQQVPPSFSAIKVGGIRSHKLAREGRQTDHPPRSIHIMNLSIINYDYPDLTVEVHCSKGTYIRALARDFGQELGCGGYLTALRRTAIGTMHIDEALTLEHIEEHHLDGTLSEHYLSPRYALDGVEHVELSKESQMRRFGHGNTVELDPQSPVGDCAVYLPNGDLCGMGKVQSGQLRPTVVFSTSTALPT